MAAKKPLAAKKLQLPIQLRWGDMDALNHVNNVQVARIFEEARIRAVTTWLTPTVFSGVPVLVARQEIEYIRPLSYTADPALVTTWISRIGVSSFDYGYILADSREQVCAVAATTLVVVDPRNSGAMPIPDEMRAVLADHLDEPPVFRQRG